MHEISFRCFTDGVLSAHARGFLVAAAVAGIVAPICPQAEADPRPAPPAGAEFERLLRETFRVFGERPKSSDRSGLQRWTAALLEQGRNAADNAPNDRYVMLKLALEGAVAAGSAADAAAALAALGEFAIDEARWTYDAAVALATGRFRCPADELLALFVTAGHEALRADPGAARRALLEADLQLERHGPSEVSADTVAGIEALRADVEDAERELLAARGRTPRPSDARLAAARAAIAGRVDGAAQRSHRRQKELADQLFREGIALADFDAPARFVRLEAAIGLAERLPDTGLAARAIEALALQFPVDRAARLVRAGQAIEAAGRLGRMAVARLYLEAVDCAMPDDVAVARAALENAKRLCDRRNLTTSDHEALSAECEDRAGAIHFVERSRELRARLAKTPDDRDAAHELGWLLCTEARHWEEGLPLLITGNRYPIWLAARRDLDRPEQIREILEVARAWWDIGKDEKRPPRERDALRARSRMWYERARPLAKGKDLIEVEKFLAANEPAKPASSTSRPKPSKAPKPAAARPDSAPVGMALDWLARQQGADGRWAANSAVYDQGVTALAVLAFQAAGSTPDAGPHREQVRRGLAWLLGQQDADTGLFGTSAPHDFVYRHAVATLAMVRGFAASGREPYRTAAQKGVGYLELHRNPYAAWRYQPRDNDNDTSVTGWCLTACLEAEAAGLRVDPAIRVAVGKWLDEVADDDGRHGYTKRGESSSRKPGDHSTRFPSDLGEAMTAVGLWCRMVLGQRARAEVPTRAAGLLTAKPPRWEPEAIDFYYWYYGTIALRKTGGREWRQWRRVLRPILVDNQRRKGDARGSWDPLGAWCEEGGRVYSTAMMCMALVAIERD